MGELSDRFAELMARLAKSDADLFRTIGAQNASIRELVDDFAPAVAEGPSPLPSLASAGLLPLDACELKALKARFGKLAEAQTWLEGRIGPAPKKPTWAVIAQTCREGAWPAGTSRAAAAKSLSAAELEARLTSLERRLERRLEERFNRLEALLIALAAAVERRQSA